MAYAAAQVVLLPADHFFEWDEAVYVAEVTPSVDPIKFDTHRAPGITLLVAPVTLVTTSVVALRVYLIFVSSAALAACFRVWSRVAGWAAPAAGGLFASTVEPNRWSICTP